MSSPALQTVPAWSCTATTLARAGFGEQACRDAADVAEVLNRDALALSSSPCRAAASCPTVKTPRPVASRCPSEPPRSIGLPVTTPVAFSPTFIE